MASPAVPPARLSLRTLFGCRLNPPDPPAPALPRAPDRARACTDVDLSLKALPRPGTRRGAQAVASKGEEGADDDDDDDDDAEEGVDDSGEGGDDDEAAAGE